MSDARGLVYAINKFLRSEISEGKLPEDKVEGVEICIQCLEKAYEIGPSEPALDLAFALQDMFQKFVSENDPYREPTDEEKAEAVQMKNEGNRHMDSRCFEDAIVSYSKAIKLDPTNPIYYCNRAAAFNLLAKYEESIRDCETALSFDPYYSKAYCWLGTAHSNLNQNWVEAVRCHQRAVELDPLVDRYQELLKTAETALAAVNARAGRGRPLVDFRWNGSLDDLVSLLQINDDRTG